MSPRFGLVLGGFMVDLHLSQPRAAENKMVVANGNSQSNSYYKALVIRLIAKEPRGHL
jgi:hypothetical protein